MLFITLTRLDHFVAKISPKRRLQSGWSNKVRNVCIIKIPPSPFGKVGAALNHKSVCVFAFFLFLLIEGIEHWPTWNRVRGMGCTLHNWGSYSLDSFLCVVTVSRGRHLKRTQTRYSTHCNPCGLRRVREARCLSSPAGKVFVRAFPVPKIN